MNGGAPASCRLTDDGEFTVPLAVMEAVRFGGLAMFNMITFDRTNSGIATGDGLGVADIEAIQTISVNVGQLPE